MNHLTILLLLSVSTTHAFQAPPTRCRTSSRIVLVPIAKNRMNIGLTATEKNVDEEKVPFFARVVKKIFKSRNGDGDDDDKTAAVTDDASLVISDDQPSSIDDVKIQASQMKALAERTRLEAQRDELLLSIDKLSKLESRAAQLDTHPEYLDGIMKDVKLLMYRLDPSTAVPSQLTSNSNMNIVKSVANSTDESPPRLLPPEKRLDAITGYTNLPAPIQDILAKSVDLPPKSNATIVIDKLIAENRLTESKDGDTSFAFTTTLDKRDLEDAEVLLDPMMMERNNVISNLFPEVTRQEPLREDTVMAFLQEVCGKDTFNPSSKPEAIPGGYIVRGTNRLAKDTEEDGDSLMDAIEKKLTTSSVYQKIQCCYILDPMPTSSQGDVLMEDLDEDEAVLLLTNYNLSPATGIWVKPLVSTIGIASLAAFALGAFSMNTDVVDQVAKAAETGEDLTWLYDLSLPIVGGMLGIQTMHELGHGIVALKDGIKIGPPTLIPSVSLGITGAITPIKSPPKNMRSLFDFAMAGPLLGTITSLGLLYVGLGMTAFTDAASLEQLPSVPVSLLRSSTLASGIIEYLLGDGLLNSPDPTTSLVKLHPLAIAGFAGLMTNALSLLPIGNTDGGRISLSFFGRSFSRVVQGTAILVLALCGLFGGDESGIFISYALYCQFFQKEAEIPCRNEVDELDSVRGLVAIAMSVVVVLTLFPLSS